MNTFDLWIIAIAVLCAVPCALLGSFLVLRQMSMMGDAISHAVLPGLAIAFIVFETRSSPAMFLGAAIVGVLTALFTQWVHSFGKVDRGAAMGVVFTTLFALGLILIVRGAERVDLDPGCVLYGDLVMTPLDTMIGGVDLGVPRAAVVLAIVALLDVLVIAAFYKELKISAFDPALATTLGINAQAMHYLLMTLVAITTVACFEAIGSILVIAMLIVPPATALLLTDRLGVMLGLSIAVGAAAAVLGHLGAIAIPAWFDIAEMPTAGLMATTAGLLFAAALVFAPRQGMLSRARHRFVLRRRILAEDVLGLLYRREESSGAGATLVEATTRSRLLAGPLAWRSAMRHLLGGAAIERTPEGLRLTDAGRRRATAMVRSHRQWEAYLAEHLPLAADHLHEPAHRLEHVRDEAVQAQLDEALRGRQKDPHGRAIPAETDDDR